MGGDERDPPHPGTCDLDQLRREAAVALAWNQRALEELQTELTAHHGVSLTMIGTLDAGESLLDTFVAVRSHEIRPALTGAIRPSNAPPPGTHPPDRGGVRRGGERRGHPADLEHQPGDGPPGQTRTRRTRRPVRAPDGPVGRLRTAPGSRSAVRRPRASAFPHVCRTRPPDQRFRHPPGGGKRPDGHPGVRPLYLT